MAFFGPDPVTEGAAISEAIGRLVQGHEQRELRKQLSAGLEAAKKLFFDENFAPRSLEDIYNATDEQKHAIRTIMELRPEVQATVMRFVRDFRDQFGPPPVRPEVQEGVRQVLEDFLGASKGTTPNPSVLAQLMAGMRPAEREVYQPILKDVLSQLTQPQKPLVLGPLQEAYQVLPGGEVKRLAFNPNRAGGAEAKRDDAGAKLVQEIIKHRGAIADAVTRMAPETLKDDPNYINKAIRYAMQAAGDNLMEPPQLTAARVWSAIRAQDELKHAIPDYRNWGLYRDPDEYSKDVGKILAGYYAQFGLPLEESYIMELLDIKKVPDSYKEILLKKIYEEMRRLLAPDEERASKE